MDTFGDVLYNLYGSTEVAWATIATPRGPARRAGHRRPPADGDRREAARRATAARCRGRGRPHLRRQRDDVRRATPAAAARRSSSGLMSTGDVGHFDADGRLFVDGPRRRNDRQRRRERVPARGRGPAVRPPRRSRRPRSSACPTTSSASACRRSSCCARPARSTARRSRPTSRQNLARYKVPRDVAVPRRAAAQRDRQGAQARAAERDAQAGAAASG